MESRRRIMLGNQVVLDIQNFISPSNFNASAQELNIFEVFKQYYYSTNNNAKYIYSIRPTTTNDNVTLPSVANTSYRYGYTIGATDYVFDVTSATNIFSLASTKRYIIVNIISSSAIKVTIPLGAVWAYVNYNVYSINSKGNSSLKYIHVSNLNTLTEITESTGYQGSFSNCSAIIGVITIGANISNIEPYPFRASSIITNAIGFDVKGTYFSTDTTTKILYNYSKTYVHSALNNITGVINLPSTVTTINGGAFQYCSQFSGISLPSSLTTIQGSAFYGCSGLTSLTIPSSVVSILASAFFGCSGLTIINNYRTTPQPITTDVFSGVNKSIPLHVPVGRKASYQANAYWNLFTNIIEDL